MTEQDAETELLKVVNRAAIDLISTHNAGLSVKAIRTRLLRIADDLSYAANEIGEEDE